MLAKNINIFILTFAAVGMQKVLKRPHGWSALGPINSMSATYNPPLGCDFIKGKCSSHHIEFM